MTLFILLLVLAWERLFKLGSNWQLDKRLKAVFRRFRTISLRHTIIVTAIWLVVLLAISAMLEGWFFNIFLLVFWVCVNLLCVGAGSLRLDYRNYLHQVRDGKSVDEALHNKMTMLFPLADDADETVRMQGVQNALLWANFRYYLAPIFLLITLGHYGAVALAAYAYLRAYQTWLARHKTVEERQASGVDLLLNIFDWLPVRFAGLMYVFVGHGEKALPLWINSFSDYKMRPYDLLSQLAQLSLINKAQNDPIKSPQAAVDLSRQVTSATLILIVVLTLVVAIW